MRPVARPVATALTLAFALLVGSIANADFAAAAPVPEPADDAFYVPPAGYEVAAPGTILRTRSVSVTGLGVPIPVRSTQALVRSTDAQGDPMAIVTTVMVPKSPYRGARPLLSYQPAIDSLGDQCQPSHTLQTGTEKELPLLALGLAKGWAVVVTDYQGPRHSFGAGRLEGQATLDGIRAAEQLPGTGLAGTATPVGLWGYSGGGLASGWAAELQPTYAPELDVKGVAAGGMPSDLTAAGRLIDGGPAAGLFLAAAVGVSREYPEILPVFNEAGRQLIQDIGDKCLAEEVIGYPFRRLADYSDSPDPLSEPVVRGVLAHNKMGTRGPTAPVYLYHSLFDELIPYASAREIRSTWCSKGTKVQFHTSYLSEHNILALSGGPAAVAYLSARFSGLRAPTNC